MTSCEVFSVTVVLTKGDLARLNVFALSRSTLARWIFVLLAVFVIARLLAIRGLPDTAPEVLAILLTTLLLVIGAAALMLLLSLIGA